MASDFVFLQGAWKEEAANKKAPIKTDSKCLLALVQVLSADNDGALHCLGTMHAVLNQHFSCVAEKHCDCITWDSAVVKEGIAYYEIIMYAVTSLYCINGSIGNIVYLYYSCNYKPQKGLGLIILGFQPF